MPAKSVYDTAKIGSPLLAYVGLHEYSWENINNKQALWQINLNSKPFVRKILQKGEIKQFSLQVLLCLQKYLRVQLYQLLYSKYFLFAYQIHQVEPVL